MQVDLATLPRRMKRLPMDPQRGVPVPWFVQFIDGVPEFRVMSTERFALALRNKLCWVCGEPTGVHLAFAVGPMCVLNRTSSEPPCHLDCARWSAINCPFLSRPKMVRREGGLPEEVRAGEAALARNPGATAVYLTKSYTTFKAPGASATGILLTMGPPERVEWYAEGRPATREEVTISIDSGYPHLAKMCEQEETALARHDARLALGKARKAVEALLPA